MYNIVDTPEELDSWAKGGGWKGADDFLEDTGATKDQVLGSPFNVTGGRITILAPEELED